MSRFVILLHEIPPGHAVAGGRGTHWDLMLEHDGALKTWALAAEPTGEISLSAEQLPDHRLAYLDYEGPVSGNRGHVTRHDAGECTWLAQSADRMEVQLDGGQGKRFVTLTHCASAGAYFWMASFSFAPTRGSSSSSSS